MAEVGGVLQGIQGGRQAKTSFRHARDAIRTATQQGVSGVEERMQGLQENPLLQGVNYQQGRELQYSPDPALRQAMYGSAWNDIQGLGGMGLSNPQVQDRIFRQTLEQTLNPEYERSRDQIAAELAARGLGGRSGPALDAMLELENQYGTRLGDTRRQIATQGAQEAFNEQLTRAQAAQDLFNTGATVASRIGQNAATIGFQQEGFLADLAKFIAQLRQQAELAMLGQAPAPASAASNALFTGAKIFNQGLAGAYGAA